VGLRSLIAKRFGPDLPPEILAGEQAAQMGPDHPFSPGEPVRPFDGYSRTPRAFDYQTSFNVATRPRTHERVSFDVLRGLIEAYDVAQVCIFHRIDSIRSLKWKLIAAENYNGDVTDAIPLGMAALRKPDRKHPFKSWLAQYLYDVLAYDAGALYRMRNRGGKCVGLLPFDGTTIAPLLDYWGNSPDAPAEAYVQYANGLPWGWLTRDDLIYEPFRPRTNSPYGHAPLESILLNANTDLRFQAYFLERFTKGNVPEAFASAPESWSPDQIEQFQNLWDSVMFGDQSQKHQIKWMPGGSSIAWSNEKEFTDAFSLFLMRKTAAAYHVVPADLGFTETVNRSSGESQADVQHRVGDLPLMEHVEGILSQFLFDDMGLPLRLEFDRGEEQDDQLDVAHSDDVYIKNGVVGASEIREMRFGLTEPEGQQVPRFVYTTRAGPIPLSSLLDVAGPTDPETAAPMPGVPLPHKEFELVEGVVPVPAPKAPALAERLYGPPAVPGAPPPGSVQPPSQPLPVAKAETAGITTGTGITSYDLDDDDEDEEREELAKAEIAAFRRFEKGRRKAGQWRDFTFTTVEPEVARHLNQRGRAQVVKAGGSGRGPKDPAEVRKATLRIGHLTGIWATIYRRRERLLNKHIKLVAAAWDACLTGLHPRDVVRDFREDAGLVAKAANPDQDWWKGAATAAAVAWLDGAYNSGGYPALVTAIEDAIREGMAEGQADALALAADKQGATGFQIGRAFTAANEQMAGDSGVAERAQDTAGKVVGGAGNDVGRALTDGAKSGAGVEDMTSDVRDAVDGDQSRSVSANTDGALSAAILAGAVALYLQAAAAQATGGGSGQGADAAAASAQPPSVLLDWITAGDDRVCDTCSGYEDSSPYTPEDVPDYPHMGCRCSIDAADDASAGFTVIPGAAAT